ncbi:aminotransferase class IV family protein [bacterium]|nr:aminotransferase class IV family protein [bacterium]
MSAYLIYNGRTVEEHERCISPLDRGFMLADGLFETLRSYNGRLPFLDLHLERLKQGMSQLGFPFEGISLDCCHIEEMAGNLLARNKVLDANIRLTVSRGITDSGPLPEWGKGRPNWALITRPLPSHLETDQENGIYAIISTVRRNSFSPTAHLKTVNYLDQIMAKREAFLQGAQEAILLNENGMVAEGATSNIFWIRGGCVYTPSLDLPVLPGVTRRKVLEIVKDKGDAYREGVYGTGELLESDEAFITNSICEVTPLIKINNKSIGDGSPGVVTRRIQAEYKDIVAKYI